MKRAAKKSTLIQEFARKVGYAAGRVVATTQELADNAAAMVSHDDAHTTAAPRGAKISSPAARTPRKHSPRRAVNKKKASSSSTASRSKSKKSAVPKKSPRIKKAAEPKPRKQHAASRG